MPLLDPIFTGQNNQFFAGGGAAALAGLSGLQQILNQSEILWLWDARFDVTSASERLSAHRDMKAGVLDSQGTGAAQPIYVPYAGTPFAWNHGVASNSLSTTDTTITGNFRITLDAALDDYTPSAAQIIVTKITGTNGFNFQVLATGKLRLNIGNGSTNTLLDSSVATNLTDFTRHTLAVNYVDGASGSATFFVDGVQLGTPVASAVTLTNSAVTISVLGAAVTGKEYSCVITNGAGTVYYDWSNDNMVEGATTFTGNDTKTYTFAQSGAVVCQPVFRPQIIYDGAAYFTSTGAQTLAQPCGVILVGMQRVWTLNRRMCGGTVINSGLFQASTTPGIKMGETTFTTQNDGWTVGSKMVVGGMLNGASSYTVVNQLAEVTGTTGNGSMDGLMTGTNQPASTFAAIQLTAKAVTSGPITAVRQRQLNAMFQAEYAA